MKRLSWLLAPVLVMALASCGGGLSEDEQKAADSLAKSFGGGLDGTEEFAQCTGEEMVQRVGLETLRTDGVIDDDNEAVTPEDGGPEKVSEEGAEGMAASIMECLDFEGQAEQLKSNEQITASDEAIDEYVACMEKVDQGRYEQMLIHQLTGREGGDKEDAEKALEEVGACQQSLSPAAPPADEAPSPEAPSEEAPSEE